VDFELKQHACKTLGTFVDGNIIKKLLTDKKGLSIDDT